MEQWTFSLLSVMAYSIVHYNAPYLVTVLFTCYLKTHHGMLDEPLEMSVIEHSGFFRKNVYNFAKMIVIMIC
jgi:hypothetical protein